MTPNFMQMITGTKRDKNVVQSSSSQDLRNRPLTSSGTAVKTSSKSKMKKDKNQQSDAVRVSSNQGGLRIIASLQSFTQMETIQKERPFSSIDSILNKGPEDSAEPTCKEEAPVTDAFVLRNYKGKIVRDVLIDTHDLINEPGGYIINLTHHGQFLNTDEINIHLGIKEKNRFAIASRPSSGIVRPGTISTTDDYARDIFRTVRSLPKLLLLTAILEINNAEDPYEQKEFDESPPEFLQKFIQTYPQTITKFHVEMPGLSPVYLPEWKFLLDQQFSLKILICNFGVVMWHFYQSSIMTNSRTLERVVLRRIQTYNIADASYFPMDWSMFAGCTKLEYLKVTCGYKSNPYPMLPLPPSSVFLHENLDQLPEHETFAELHLSNIWVEGCVLDEFFQARPKLTFCGRCNDLEYYDGDKTVEDMKKSRGEPQIQMRVITQVSQVDLDIRQVEIPDKDPKPPKRSRQKQLACIVLVLFHVILLALAIMFIIIYFRHLRNKNDDNSKRGKRIHLIIQNYTTNE